MTFDLLIWDCDGCLVDSEVLACQASVSFLESKGVSISVGEFADLCVGTSGPHSRALIYERTGYTHTDEDVIQIRRMTIDAFSNQLKAINGVHEAIKKLNLPMCIASGSTVERNYEALRITGLLPFFDEKIYSSYQVANGKPAPDVFLFAANQMGVEPDRSLVIEDSVAGVQAAKAAGMTVFAFLGGSHVNPAWRARVAAQNPDVLFDDMRQLPGMIEQYKVTA